jgi:serine/threonine protein kinase
MSSVNHPFILKLNGVAQDKRIIYLYMEFMEGGDLMGVLNKVKKFSKEEA